MEWTFRGSRTAIFAVAALGLIAPGAVSHGQSPDPVVLRQIINQINAKAAADSFSNIAPPAAAATGPSSSSQPSNSSHSGSPASPTATASNAGSGPAGFAALSADGDGASSQDSSASGASATTPDPNYPAAAAQSYAQDAATPSTQPRDSVAAADATPDPPAPTTKARPATVTYSAGLLTVRADDSSLNLILRQIARLTGMKISGGVADERVFGDYGPSKPSTILTTLLDGTRSDMVLRQGSQATITELVLIPRGGGAVPPSPNASVWDPDEANGK